MLLFAALAAFLGLIAAAAWYRVNRAIDQHGTGDARFANSLSSAATATMLTLILAGVAGLLLVFT